VTDHNTTTGATTDQTATPNLTLVLQVSAERLLAAMTSATVAIQVLTHQLRADPCLNRRCFCHPLPFPAARDYRRRTKHRNRRRK
jgi:hypothetical protein